MTRAELFALTERLSEDWSNLAPGVIDKITSYPSPVAAMLAAVVSSHLDELFLEGTRFRAALAERAARN